MAYYGVCHQCSKSLDEKPMYVMGAHVYVCSDGCRQIIETETFFPKVARGKYCHNCSVGYWSGRKGFEKDGHWFCEEKCSLAYETAEGIFKCTEVQVTSS